ncbi:MAG: PQQ-binding-like beta-propeller repeat protein [Bacteroidales bacterium]|nr:PQQ-binding-like beta-propeller repeat protein [Bacteroidales bacterium]
MTKMTIYIYLFSIIFSIGCKKPPIDPPPPVENTKTNLSVVWQNVFYSDSTAAYFHDPYFSNEYVAFCSYQLVGVSNINAGIGVYNKETGVKHTLWNNEPGSTFNMTGISDWKICGQNNNLAAFCNGSAVKCYDINDGSEIWSITDDFLPRINDFGPYLYCSDVSANRTNANLYRIELETGAKTRLFTAYKTNGYEPSLESYSGWISPWGDSILIFQNRQWNFPIGDGRVDIYAYNLKADTVLWIIEDISTDGNSSIQKPNIVGNCLFFQGIKSQHCIDLIGGEVVWEHQYENAGFASVENLYADGKLFARSQDNLIAYDAQTGTTLWKIDNTYGLQTGGRMGYYQGNIFLTGIDLKHYLRHPQLFCINAIDGSLKWKGNRVYDGAPIGNMKDGVIINQNTGYLYVNDSYRIICIDLNNTPLDISK